MVGCYSWAVIDFQRAAAERDDPRWWPVGAEFIVSCAGYFAVLVPRGISGNTPPLVWTSISDSTTLSNLHESERCNGKSQKSQYVSYAEMILHTFDLSFNARGVVISGICVHSIVSKPTSYCCGRKHHRSQTKI